MTFPLSMFDGLDLRHFFFYRNEERFDLMLKKPSCSFPLVPSIIFSKFNYLVKPEKCLEMS